NHQREAIRNEANQKLNQSIAEAKARIDAIIAQYPKCIDDPQSLESGDDRAAEISSTCNIPKRIHEGFLDVTEEKKCDIRQLASRYPTVRTQSGSAGGGVEGSGATTQGFGVSPP